MSELPVGKCSQCKRELFLILKVTEEYYGREPIVSQFCAKCAISRLPPEAIKESWLELTQKKD